MADQGQVQQGQASPDGQLIQYALQNTLTVRMYSPNIRLYTVSEELLTLYSGLNRTASISLTFLSMSVGALVTLVTTLLTTEIKIPTAYAVYFALAVLSAVLTLFFGLTFWHYNSQAEEALKRIRESTTTLTAPASQ